MLLTAVLVLLYAYVVVRAVYFFVLPGPIRDDDKIIGASMVAASLMFITARVLTVYLYAKTLGTESTALWAGFGLMNGMLYLGLLHRMIAYRQSPQRRHQASHIKEMIHG